MERKELEAESIGTWDGDIAEYTDYHQYYPKEEADAVMDKYESQIKELRYERTMWKALMFENLAAVHSWQGHDPRIDSAEAWKECHDYYRCVRIAKALKARARKIKETK